MSQWNSDTLTTYRTQADTPADALMQAVIAHDAQSRVNEVFAALAYNNSFETANLPAVVKEFVAQASALPAWYDADATKRGEEVFAKYGVEICIVLICKSLPECYLCWRGARVLFETGRLMEQRGDLSRMTRRIAETLQFIINVMAEGGTAPDGKGIVTAQKIRLIHASIRTYIKQHRWDVEELGEPINQEDLALTLTTFSSSVLEGLEMLDIRLNDAEREAYMHCWRVIGYYMGLDEVFLTDSYQDSLDLQKAILEVQAGSSVANRALAKSCVDFVEYLIPSSTWKDVVPAAMKFFLGRKYAKMLGIKQPFFSLNTLRFALIHAAFWLLGLGEQHSRFLQGIIKALSKDVIQGLVLYFNHYKKVQFDIPPSLRGEWKLE
jgi:hypothetical protein